MNLGERELEKAEGLLRDGGGWGVEKEGVILSGKVCNPTKDG